MKKITLALLTVGIFLSQPLSAEVVDKIVAIVGGDIITLSDIKNYSSQSRSEDAKVLGVDSKDPLQALIREKLLKMEMDRLKVEATDQEIQGAIQEVLQRNKANLPALKAELEKKGISFEKYKKDLADQIRRMKFLSQVVFPRIKIADVDLARKAGKPTAKLSQDERIQARASLIESRSPEELNKYLDEVRAKTYVEIHE